MVTADAPTPNGYTTKEIIMEELLGIETKHGIITGRDGIFLDSIEQPNERTLILKGEFNVNSKDIPYEIIFSNVVYLRSIELDFDQRCQMESFGIIQNSKLRRSLGTLDHSSKINTSHKHYYLRTYDTVFEIIANEYTLIS